MSPAGLVVCGLATLVAIPVLFLGSGSVVTVDASDASASIAVSPSEVESVEGSAISSIASADSLLDEVDQSDLFDGGADPSSIGDHQAGDATSPVTVGAGPPSVEAPSPTATTSGSEKTRPRPSAIAASSPADKVVTGASAAGIAASTPSAAPSTAAPTTPAPTTRAPSTAAPTTPAPSTAAPTTPAPSTAAPTTPAPSTAAPTTAAPTAAPTPAPSTAAPTTAAPTTAPAPIAAAEPAPTGPTPAQWDALRQCESYGNYAIVSSSGKYQGAYQFSQGTWDSTARSAGRADLVGIAASKASPADQDALALHLWSLRGWAPWPSCSREVG